MADDPRAALKAGYALGNSGRYAEAEVVFDAWLAGHPGDRDAAGALQRVRLLQGRVSIPEGVAERVALARTLAGLQDVSVLQGAYEGPRLQLASEILLAILPDLPKGSRPTAARILWRTAHYDAANSLGRLTDLGRHSALHGAPDDLLRQLPKIETDADRAELLHQHRLWAETLEQAAAAHPIARVPRAAVLGRLRLGVLSSDLRHHVVGYFAQPLFEFRDPCFDLYAYSTYSGPPDPVEPLFERQATAFRRLPGDDRAAAQVIADDDLDILVELGGPTSQSRPGILAYKPAPLQVSWLGYPHSLGLSAMDHLVADPHVVPRRRDLLLEEPLLMPDAWICMSPAAFPDAPALEPTPPCVRKGFVTFGTANDPYKMTPRLLRTWARIVAAVPDARFMVLRPEAGAASFRDNVAAYFAEAGVTRDRLDFRAVRGGVRPLYAEMDIALDTFPLTGGTTTCEALWMGVPTITLAGPAFYERLSASILANVMLPELVTETVDQYVQAAVDLAGAPARLAELRGSMRQRIRMRPIGQPKTFAGDFYALMAAAIARRAARADLA